MYTTWQSNFAALEEFAKAAGFQAPSATLRNP
jgi:hypothetical protein